MWKPWTWATASHEQAVRNARAASTACSRRRVERADVALYLKALAHRAEARPVVEHPA